MREILEHCVPEDEECGKRLKAVLKGLSSYGVVTRAGLEPDEASVVKRVVS